MRKFSASVQPALTPRFDRLDALRGVAMLWMTAFHFCFDLSHFGLVNANFYEDSFWTLQRTFILSLFLICAGAGQAVALHQNVSWHRFGRRWGQIVACAVLVSIGSALMFPQSFIYFGVLHGMAVMLLITRLLANHPKCLLFLGFSALLLPLWLQHPFFDSPSMNWVGLVTHKPITEDYVPLTPWLGMMVLGFLLTQWLLKHKPSCFTSSHPPSLGLGALARLGQWSLTYYMLHQPVLIGALSAWMLLTGRPLP